MREQRKDSAIRLRAYKVFVTPSRNKLQKAHQGSVLVGKASTLKTTTTKLRQKPNSIRSLTSSSQALRTIPQRLTGESELVA